MDTANYNLLSAQIANANRFVATANDVANINTNGYKADHITFEQHLTKDINNMNAMPFDRANIVDVTDGDLKHTGRELDLAIQGEGFFSIATPLGTRYTRAGHFLLNSDYQLITPLGHQVLSENGDIVTFNVLDKAIMFDSEGRIFAKSSEQDNYEERGKLGVISLSNLQGLRKTEDNNFTADAGIEVIQADVSSYRVAQGFVEGSNISSERAMTNLIEIQQNNGLLSSLSRNMQDTQKQAQIYNILSKTG